jgi:hypothetical protein
MINFLHSYKCIQQTLLKLNIIKLQLYFATQKVDQDKGSITINCY